MAVFGSPELQALAFVSGSALAILYFLFEKLRIGWRLKRLGLREGTHQVELAGVSQCEIELHRPKYSHRWWLAVRVQSLRSRTFEIALPVEDSSPWAKLGQEFRDFSRRAFELGMDRILQKERCLQVISASFRPLKDGYPGFLESLAKGLESIDWKLSSVEGDHGLEASLPSSGKLSGRIQVLLALVFASICAYAEPALDRHATLFDPSPAYWAGLGLLVLIFVTRWWNLRKKYRMLKRRRPVAGEAFWPALAWAVVVVFPIQHFNIRMDRSAGRLLTAEVVDKRTTNFLGRTTTWVRLRSLDTGIFREVEIDPDDFRAVVPDRTRLPLRVHPGVLGMEWAEQVSATHPHVK